MICETSSPAITATAENDTTSTTRFPSVYDVTIGYPGYHGEVPDWNLGFGRKFDKEIGNLKTLMEGKSQPLVHLHFQKIDGEEVGSIEGGFLDRIWENKEARMDYFAKHQAFQEAEKGYTDLPVPKSFLTLFLFLLSPIPLIFLFPAAFSLSLLSQLLFAVRERLPFKGSSFAFPLQLFQFSNKAE